MSRIVVIGAGVGGLAAAARLSARGHRVTLVEQSGEVGGKLGTLEDDGFVFDTGPSLVTMPQVFTEFFASTGGQLADQATEELELQRLEVACRYTFPDGSVLDMPGDQAAIPAAINAALGPGLGDQWASFMRRAEHIWDVTHEPFLESPISVTEMLRLSRRLPDIATVAPWRSLRSLGAAYLRDPRLRQLLDRYATYTGSDPRRAPAALAAVPYAEQAFGSWYVPGGLYRIAEALLARAVSLGTELMLDTEVAEIVTTGRRVSGVRTVDGRLLPADLVVANADAAQVYERLISEPLARRSVGRAARGVARATPSLSGFVMLLSLEQDAGAGSSAERATDLAVQPHHHVLFGENYDDEFDSIFGSRRLWGGVSRARPVAQPTLYISAPPDPALVPGPSQGSWFVLVNAPRHDPRGGVDWTREGLAEEYADRLLEQLAKRGLDVRPHLRHRIVRSPSDLERLTLTPGGSIYGTASNGARAAFLRPANRSPVRGLFLVGGSSHPGGGLPLVMLSARIVDQLIGPA